MSVALLGALLAGGASAAENPATPAPSLTVHPVRALAGEEVEIQVSGLAEEAKIEVVLRPGSAVSRVETLGSIKPGVPLAWTPSSAGLVRLRLVTSSGTSATFDMAVHAGAPSPAALATVILAGLILFGGAGIALRRHLAGG